MIRKDELCDCGSRKKCRKYHCPFDKGDLLRYLTVLIRVSNHFALVLPYCTES
ncbi:uncharacterized protein C8Q71DRAFT_431752 [Rhodofomes roseus]|uniref:Uncharacterized protein n=1 Tax=Rhodofomes roseus TaxID=34475 RepID=A0ABQ8KQY2_9APHY|nr:uncharacterized protein C8Q71DRAFT_431752 [Rhodofomes roseus]KAH9840945.1 hypothetical protein C8Q71DRAFT_431752 [Rhodofomes roseus]